MLHQQAAFHKVENPIFNKPTKPSYKSLKWATICICLLICIVLLIALIGLRSEKYAIRFIVYSGNIRVSSDTITQNINSQLHKKFLRWVLPYHSVYGFPSKKIASEIKKQFGFSQVSIDVIRSEHVVHVRITEQPAAYALKFPNATYIVSNDGMILEQASENWNSQGLLTIQVSEGTKDDSVHALPQQLLVTVLALQNAKIADMRLLHINLQAVTSTDVQVYTDAKWYVYVDIARNVPDQLNIAQTIFNEKIKGTPDEKTLQYIDVRIPERAYYK